MRALNTGPFMILLRLSPLFLFSACEPEIPEDATMLAMGDSYFDYHEGSDIPDVAAARSGHVVYNAAISGAQLSSEEYAIPSQWVDGDWQVLLLNGGGNDANDQCSCGACDAVLDGVISPNADSGVLVDLIQDTIQQGTPVVFMAYPEPPDGAEHGFDECRELMHEQSRRVKLLAEEESDLSFVDAGDVISPTNLDYFEEDQVHPSELGARVIGEYIAQFLPEPE